VPNGLLKCLNKKECVPMIESSVEKLAESKLTILYLLHKIGIPMSKGQICRFALEINCVEYFSLQNYIFEMVENNFIREIKDSDKLIYVNTDEGEKILSLFIHKIPKDIIEKVDSYILRMKTKVRRELDTKADYFHIGDGNYVVNCAVYENEKIIFELKMTVTSKEQAILACKNWKAKTDTIYFDNVANLLKK